MALRFEWDPRKAAANLEKHGASFQEATSAFRDPLSVTISDPDHAGSEERFIDLGLSYRARLLVVSYIERGGGLRIISARRATRAEQSQYEDERP